MNQPNLIASETEDKNIITITTVKKRPRVDANTVLDDPALYKQIEYCEAVKRAKRKSKKESIKLKHSLSRKKRTRGIRIGCGWCRNSWGSGYPQRYLQILLTKLLNVYSASSARLPGATPATAADVTNIVTNAVTNAVAEIKSLVYSLENARIREQNCKAFYRNNYPLYRLIKEVAARGGHPAPMGNYSTQLFPRRLNAVTNYLLIKELSPPQMPSRRQCKRHKLWRSKRLMLLVRSTTTILASLTATQWMKSDKSSLLGLPIWNESRRWSDRSSFSIIRI